MGTLYISASTGAFGSPAAWALCHGYKWLPPFLPFLGPISDELTRCTNVHTMSCVEYEWDPVKAQRNIEKHQVDFADAVGALEDELAITVSDPYSRTEDRFLTIGMDPFGRLLLVVFTWRGERLRLISARKATRRERRQYKEGSHA